MPIKTFVIPAQLSMSVCRLCLFSLVIGCSQQSQETQSHPRPVKVVRIGNEPGNNTGAYAAEVRPRHETALSFRVSGKVTTRPVETGDHVRKGQLLAALDQSDYQLGVQALKAQIKSADAERRFSADELKRYRELLAQQVISQPDYDRHEAADTAARERVEALKAQLAQAVNQLEYALLIADRDGVVTALEVETGEVVAAGRTIVKLAGLDDKEICFDLPEQRIADIKTGQQVGVTLWADGDKKIKAQIREIAAAADPVSRTFRVKASLPEKHDDMRLGMTATVWISSHAAERIAVPLSAIFTTQGEPKQAKVWKVDEQAATVRALPVQTGAMLTDERVAVSGLSGGELIVSAGVHRLVEGQAVRLTGAD
ncbi:MAG: efflux RND transporter periplasmic adaptor subunit [Methylobacter sp.]